MSPLIWIYTICLSAMNYINTICHAVSCSNFVCYLELNGLTRACSFPIQYFGPSIKNGTGPNRLQRWAIPMFKQFFAWHGPYIANNFDPDLTA